MRLPVWVLGFFLLGCGGGDHSYFPLEPGNEWQYDVKFDPDYALARLKVVGEAPVGPYRGFLVSSELGDSRLAWVGQSLLAAELAGTGYSPPIPILAADKTRWSGVVTTAATRTAGSATLSRSKENLDIGGRSYQTVKCEINLKVGTEHVQLTTWFFSGLGILRQEQRSGPALTRNRLIEHVRGPS